MEKKKTFRSRSGKKELGLWKERYETLDEKYERMKTIIKQVFKDLKEETEKQQYLKKQYDNMKKELNDKENLLERLQSVSEAVVEEYSTLKTKYEMESEAATSAMKRATKYQKENQALKRQSAMLIQKVMTAGGTIDLDQLVAAAETEDKKEQDNEQENTEIDLLNQTVSKLRSEVIDLQMQLKKEKEQQHCLKEDIEIARKLFEEEMMAHNTAKEKLKWMEQSVNQLKRVSELYVVQEFENLQLRYQKESDKVKRMSAEIAVVQKENNILSQQQAILLENSTLDDQLAEALKKVEELTAKLEEEICKHHLEVDELKESLKEAKSEVLVKNLKDKLQCMEQCLQQTEQRAYSSERQVETLQQKVRELECQTQRLQAGLPPPCPPPPPPPPPAFNPIKSLMTLITAGKKVTANIKKEKSESHQQKAMTEMIETIKKGNVRLRPTPKGTTTDDSKDSDSSSAVNEMMNILNSMKRKHHSPVASPRSVSPDEPPSELLEKLQRRRELSVSPERVSPKEEKHAKDDDVDDELQRIFRKKSLTSIMTEMDELCQPTFSGHILDEIYNSTPDSLTEGETSGSTTDYNIEEKATPSPTQFVQLRRNRITGEEMCYLVEENLIVDSMQVNLEQSKRSTFVVESPRKTQNEQCSSQIKENLTCSDICINDQFDTNPESLNKLDREIKIPQGDVELSCVEENVTHELQINQDHSVETEKTVSDHSTENISETVKENQNNHYSVLGVQAGKNLDNVTCPLSEHENNLHTIHTLSNLTDSKEFDSLNSKDSLVDYNESKSIIHNVDTIDRCSPTETELSVLSKKDEPCTSLKSQRDSETGIMLSENNSESENLSDFNKINSGTEVSEQDKHDS